MTRIPETSGTVKRGLPWFRLYAAFCTDAQVQMLSESDQRRLIMVLCIQAKYLESVISDADTAWRLRISEQEWKDTKDRLAQRGLIDGCGRATYDGAREALRRPSSADWAGIRSRIFARDDYTCRYCGQRGQRLECDHVVPVSRGGDHSDENLVTSCLPCNRAKRDKVVSVEDWRAAREVRS